jgi:hypothetical protein
MDDRSSWPVYARVPITDPDVLAVCERAGAPKDIPLRQCPVCGAKEREEGPRIVAESCDMRLHYPQEEPKVIVPRRTGDDDDFDGPTPLPETRRLQRVADLFGQED